MAASNTDRLWQGLGELAKALEPWMRQRFESAYGPDWADRIVRFSNSRVVRDSKGELADPYVQLTVLIENWRDSFGKVLGQAERSYVGELLDVRNKLAHPAHDRPLSSSDTERALDTMARVANAISAPEQAKQLHVMRAQVLRTMWEAATKVETKRQAELPVPGTTAAGVRPWRDVTEPHPDVAAGRYAQAEFAADLGQVVRGDAGPEYGDPKRFFERTFLTAGLTDLLTTSLQRIAGKPEGEPVMELQTNFGGGKTHSMLALYHLLSGETADNLRGADAVLAKASMRELPSARRVVLVGTALPPGQPRRIDGIEIRTLWGELAWQLGGREAFERIAESDSRGVSPGSDNLRQLLNDFGPALILIDEWVTFVRQLWTDSTLPAGSFDANMSFAQALTEAVKASDSSLLVVSLPASDIEKGGEGGQVATDRLKAVLGRIHSPWRPASPEEGFEIVRRRLFSEIPGERYPARDATVQAFADLYARHTGDFPAEAREAAYQSRMTACYPIHPDLFDQLFGTWSTLEKFQQTRGVLRLMAAVIHALWERGDPSPLILPASVPIDESRVQSELTRYLEEQWVPVIERDVDGEHSLPMQLDRENPATLGRAHVARRVARTIYIGSAPTANVATRGIDDRRIKLGTVLPGEQVAVFGDALRRLSDRATYMFTNAGRYWYSTQASVNRLAADRAGQQREDDVLQEVRTRLRRAQMDRAAFARVHAAPSGAGDVPDDDEVALVILGPEATHSSRSEKSVAREAARTLLDQRGTGARRHRNMLVFLAADTDKLGPLLDATRQYLAWKSIDEGKADLTLDSFQVNQITTKQREADETVNARIPEAYQWLLVPTQPDPLGQIDLAPTRLSGSGSLGARASNRMNTDGTLINRLGAVTLRLALDRHPEIWADGDVDLRQLWELFTTYVYLPRLRDHSVLTEAVREGAGGLMWRDAFAYAAGKLPDGRYLGLVTGGRQFEPLLDGQGRIVKPEIAAAQIPEPPAPQPYPPGASHPSPAAPGGTREVALPTRFFGAISVDGVRPGPKLSSVATDVIAHLAGLDGADIDVTLEIRARRPGGFPPDVVRTVTENANQLKFEPGTGFEGD